jgi:ATP-dependent RNA helicase RhlE
VVRALAKSGLAAEAIHGNKSQNQRERVLGAFRTGHLRTLVATDIAARGIDVDGISHVINYDLPNIPESYVHRIGRTARAGADGVAISFCDAEERAYLRDIEKLIRISIPATDRRSGHARSNDAHQARPQHKQPQKQQPQRQQQQKRDGKQRNAQPAQKPRHSSNQQHRQQQGQRPAAQRPAAQHPAASNGGIAGIAFMQPTRNARRPRGNGAAPRYGEF